MVYGAENTLDEIKKNDSLYLLIESFTDGINGFEVEKKEFGNCFGTSEFKEGTKAFMEKRKPNF